MSLGELLEGRAESVLVFLFVSVSRTGTGNSFAGASLRLKSHKNDLRVQLCCWCAGLLQHRSHSLQQENTKASDDAPACRCVFIACVGTSVEMAHLQNSLPIWRVVVRILGRPQFLALGARSLKFRTKILARRLARQVLGCIGMPLHRKLLQSVFLSW